MPNPQELAVRSDETEETLAIRQNAIELLEEAKLLLDHGRTRRAIALAIICIEECGSYHLKRWGYLGSKMKNMHSRKQQVSLSMHSLCTIISALRGLWSELNEQFGEDRTAFFNHVLRTEPLRRRIVKAMLEAESTGLPAILSGKLSYHRNSSLYSCDRDGSIQDHSPVNVALAREYISEASFVLEWLD
jgi:AbiV family abortive infection protein